MKSVTAACCAFFAAGSLFAAPTPYSVNVRDYGAVGDGVHDDTLALQKAADAARVDSHERGQLETMVKLRLTCTQDGPVPELYFPKGVYRTTGPVVFTGNAFLRGEEAEIRNETADKDTFFFDLGFRVDIEGLRFTGGRNQVRQFTQNRDIAAARIARCSFERSRGTALLLDCNSDVKVQRSAGKAAFFKPMYEKRRTPEGRVELVDVDPASRISAANSTIILVENCMFRDCAQAILAHSDGVNVDNCKFFDSGVARGPIVQVWTTVSLSRLGFYCSGSVPGRTAIAFGGGNSTATDIAICAPEGIDPFFFAARPAYAVKDSQGNSIALRNISLDAGTNPVLTVGSGYMPEAISVDGVRRVRPKGAKPRLIAFQRMPTEAEVDFWAAKNRQSRFGVKGVFGWSAANVDDYDLDLPAHLARLRCRSGRLVLKEYLAPAKQQPGDVFTDPSIGVADFRRKQDDTDRLEALLGRASAAGGGTVLLPPRWITLSRTLSVPRNVRITAAGKAVLRSADYRLVFFRADGEPDAVFENLLFNKGATVFETTSAKGLVRFDNCHFYDQDGVTLRAKAPGSSKLRLEVRYGTSFVPHLYDGNAAPAVFDAFWLEYAPDFGKEAWDKVSEKSQTCMVNRRGGVLRCYDILGVPCVYWHAAQSSKESSLKRLFFTWVARPEEHPELYGDFRWVDNYGDYMSLDFRYGGEWAGLTPVYQYGDAAKSLIAGHKVAGSLYGWTKAKHATVLSDREQANVALVGVFYINRMQEPATVLWRDKSGRLARAKGWTSEDCYPHASTPYTPPDVPSRPAATLSLILPPGTADDPSAVCPLRVASAPVAVWYDRNAIHVGAEAFSWKSLGVEPKEGAKAVLPLATPSGGRQDVTVTLSSAAPKFRLGDFGVIGNRVVTNSVEIVPTKGAVFSTRLFATGPRPDYLMQRKSKRIAAGTRGVIPVGGRAPQSGKLNFRFWTVDGQFYYYLADVFHAPEAPFDFQTLWASPAGDVLHVKFGGWTDDPGCRLRLTMNDLLTDTIPAWSAELPIGPSDGDRTLDFDVKDLPGGFYRVHVDFLDAAGKVVHSDLARLMRPSGPMPWEGTTLGSEDTVPPPWTKPVFGEDGSVCVWNREIRIGGKGVVEQIVNGGTPMLAAPATLVWNGTPLTFDVKRTECRNASATYLLTAREAPVSVEAFCEFDGHVRFQTTYRAPVDSLSWRIPLARRNVIGFDDCSAEGNPDVLIPRTGEWSRAFNPEKTPFWWAPGQIGLMGGFYNLHGTRIRQLDKAVSVRAAGDVVTVTSAFVDTPLARAEVRTVRHYLEPTPVKPKNRALASLDMDQLVWWTGHLCDFFETKYPGFDDPLRFKPMRDKIRQGKRVYFYNGSCGASPEDPIWNWFQGVWTRTEPGDYAREAPLPTPYLRQHNNWTCGCLAEKGFFESKLWGVNWYFNEPAPEAKDLYFDLANPHQCLNKTHACVWTDDFGVVHHDWSTEPTRELHKRVYRLVKAKNGDGLLHGHPGCRRTPGDVFFDSISTGEALMFRVQRNYNYYDVFTPEMMQSYFVPRATEMVVHTPPQLRRSRECLAPELLASYDPHDKETDRAIRHCAAYEKIHDLCIPRNSTHAEGDQFFKVDSPIRHLGAGTKYAAYFHLGPQPVTLSSPGPRQLWAWFSAGRKGVLVLLNDTDEPVRQTVSVKGLSSIGTELLDGDRFDFSSGSCLVNLGPRGAKFIGFN